jgi:hypothetical protein
MKGLAKRKWYFTGSLLSITLALFGCTRADSLLGIVPASSDSLTPVVAISAVASQPEVDQLAPSLTVTAPVEAPSLALTQTADLQKFSRRVANGEPDTLCGLYVPGVLALRVVQQPTGDPSFISTEDGTATQFQKVNAFDAVGLLAHNTLAGRDFFKLTPGQDLVLTFGDGRAEHYRISETADYQRLTLADLRSDFLSLATHEQQTADQVFAKFYRQAHRLTLQTCLKRENVPDWGVHFVVADPQRPAP